MRIKDCGDGDCENGWLIAQMMMALKPFADFADTSGKMPPNYYITALGPFAEKQLTMGHCYDAKRLLDKLKEPT